MPLETYISLRAWTKIFIRWYRWLSANFLLLRGHSKDFERTTFSCIQYKFMGGSRNRGTPKSCIFLGFPTINQPFLGIPIYGNPHIMICMNHIIMCVDVCQVINRSKVRILSGFRPSSFPGYATWIHMGNHEYTQASQFQDAMFFASFFSLPHILHITLRRNHCRRISSPSRV